MLQRSAKFLVQTEAAPNTKFPKLQGPRDSIKHVIRAQSAIQTTASELLLHHPSKSRF